MIELRCPHNMFGILEARVFEVKCRTRRCGARPGVVVLHRFDLGTGALIDTRLFRDPTRKEVKTNGTSKQQPSVRTA